MEQNNFQTTVQTKSKSLTKTIAGIALFTLIASGITGSYAALGSYSAATGTNIFNITARPDHAGGGGGKTAKAALKVYLSNEVISQSVVVGTVDHTFAKLVLDASALSKDVQINEINFTVQTNSKTNPSEVSNFRIYDGVVQLATANDPDSGTSVSVNNGSSATVTFTLTNPLLLPGGASAVLTVKADVSTAAAIGGIYRVGIPHPADPNTVIVDAIIDQGKLTVNYLYSNGTEMNFIRQGTLIFITDADTPKAGLIPGNTSGLTLAKIRLASQNEDALVEKIYFTGKAENGGGWDQVDAFYISYADVLIPATVTTTDSNPNGTVLVDMSADPLLVSKDQPFTISLKADTADVGPNTKGASFQGISVGINSGTDITAKGASSGNALIVSGSSSFGNPQYLVRSFPVVATNDLLPPGKSIIGGSIATGIESGKSLYAFSVLSSNNDDIGLEHVKFSIQAENVDLTNLRLVDSANGTIVATGTPSLGLFPLRQTIASGASARLFVLKGDVTCTQANGCASPSSPGSVIVVSLLGDSAFPNPVPGQYPLVFDNFKWTDFWKTPILQYADSNVFTENQWAGGYLLPTTNGGYLAPTSTSVIFSR